MKKHYVKKKENKKVVTNNVKEKTTFLLDKPILHITLKSLLVMIVVGLSLYYSDNKGYFNPDASNSHTQKKWDAYYKFSERNDIDILLLGNSHLYTGVNPKNLCNTLGVNSFILAAPGSNISDTYYGLKEALKKANPKLVVIETYGIKDFKPHELKDGDLSDQFKSFQARKDFFTKLTSTPHLFKTDNYFYAWSNTLRNHDFIFKDTAQLSKNKVLMNSKPKKNNKLYLGRFVRFQKGIQDDVLAKYDSLGAPVDGGEYSYSSYAEEYVKNIVKLCKKKNIELMFLTLPMYHKHIDNYLVWNEKIDSLLGEFPNKWLNLQNPYDTAIFTKNCFESTYKKNQHMTYSGSLIATYRLAEFIKSELDVELPDRKNEAKWKNVFYGEEGYFENNSVKPTDKDNVLLCENFTTRNVVLKEVSLIKSEDGKSRLIIAKIDKDKVDLSKCKLKLGVSLMHEDKLKIAIVNLSYDKYHKISDMFVFKAAIKPIEIKEIKEGLIICD